MLSNEDFNSEIAVAKLNDLVKQYWLKYCDIVRKRFEVEVRKLFGLIPSNLISFKKKTKILLKKNFV